MKQVHPLLWIKNHWCKLIILILSIIVLALISTKKVHSPSESIEENVPADPVTESRGL